MQLFSADATISLKKNLPIKTYSNVPNKRACMFISGKVCLLTLIESNRQSLPIFGTLEYIKCGKC